MMTLQPTQENDILSRFAEDLRIVMAVGHRPSESLDLELLHEAARRAGSQQASGRV